MQILDALERFLLQLEADGRSAHTIGQYRRHVRLLARWLAQEGHGGDVRDVVPEDFARFLTAPEARARPDGGHKKATSSNALRSSIRGFFAFVHRAGLAPMDPSRLIRRAITAPPPPRALRPTEEQKLLAVLRKARGPHGARDRMLVELMLATGVRLSSALGLEVGDVDLDEGVLVLRRAKGNRLQRVLLGEGIRRKLERHLDGRTSGAVFPGRAGGQISARHAQRRFRQWREKAGIGREVTPHSLRHAFGQRIYDRSGDLLLTMRALGHRSISSTIVYARASERRLREALL